MIRVENHCVDCGLPCMGSACKYREVEVYYCDKCGEEIDPDEIYEVDGEDFCEYCLKETFRKDID